MSKKILLITGVCGRIGTQVVNRMGSEYTIVGLALPRAMCAQKKVDIIPCDLSSDASVIEAFQKIEKVYGTKICSVLHMAAYYSFAEKHSPKYEQITVRGTGRLLKALQNFEVEQFIFTSTMLVHGSTQIGRPIRESDLLDPSWDYPISKVETEQLIHSMRRSIPAVYLRIAGIYDDFCNSIPISNQIKRIYENQFEAHFFPGNLNHGSSFVHMEDVVDAVSKTIEKRGQLPPEVPILIGEPKTLSYGYLQNCISQLLYHRPYTTIRIPKIVAKLGAAFKCAIASGRQPFIRPWMIDFADNHYELDISCAKKLLGWTPHHRLEQTMPKMIENLKKDPIGWYELNGLDIPLDLQRTGSK